MANRKNPQLHTKAIRGAGQPTQRQLTLPERVVEFSANGLAGIWQLADFVRRNPQALEGSGHMWQPWCYLPVNVVTGLVAHLLRDEYDVSDVEAAMTFRTRLLTATSGWRMTKGVYVFDPDVLSALVGTTAEEEPPYEMFLHLPEWCPYIVTPGLEMVPGVAMHGFFAYVDDRAHGATTRTHPPELNFEIMLDPGSSTNDDLLFALAAADATVLAEAMQGDEDSDLRARVLQVARSREFVHVRTNVPLGQGSFLAATTLHLQSIAALNGSVGRDAKSADDYAVAYWAQLQAKLGSLLLYLVSEKADVPAGLGHSMESVRIGERKGLRTYAAKQIKKWDVGFRIGAQIRTFQAGEDAQGEATGTGFSMRPHVRKAHWHSFWTGPRDQLERRRKKVRWLPPIPVNVDGSESLVPTAHKVLTATGVQH